MFTGIVQSVGQVTGLQPNAFGVKLMVSRESALGNIAPGDSVCVSGVCLTAAEVSGDSLTFDVISQTLQLSALGGLDVGDRVNLETAVTPSQPMGGHFMQGHVDGVGQVVAVRDTDEEWRITIEPPAELLDYLIPQGSVAVDGVSLTIASLTADTFDVALIPTTLDRTTLRDKTAGHQVNLEADMLAKTVVHLQRRQQQKSQALPPLTMQTLKDAGFAIQSDQQSAQ